MRPAGAPPMVMSKNTTAGMVLFLLGRKVPPDTWFITGATWLAGPG